MKSHSVTFASPLAAFGTSRVSADDAEWSEPCRTAPVPTLTFPRSAFGVQIPRRAPTLVHPGRALLPRPDVEYRRVAVGTAGDRTDWLWVERATLEENLGDLEARWRGNGWSAPVDGPTLLALRRLVATPPEPDADPAAGEARALEVLGAVARSFADAPRAELECGPRRQRLAFETIGYLVERLGRPFRLQEVARAVNVTPSHLCVVFKAATGRTLTAYLRRLRLCEALNRLTGRGLVLSELALELGFSSPSHFAARFGREFGLPPSRARELLARGERG